MFLIIFVFSDRFVIPLNGKTGAHRERWHHLTTDPFFFLDDLWKRRNPHIIMYDATRKDVFSHCHKWKEHKKKLKVTDFETSMMM